MDDFLFEDKFCQHFKYLRENVEVFVSFNINHCLSILNDKITMPLCNKLHVENEKSRLDKFAVNCKLSKQGWQILCEIATYISDFHYGSILFNWEFAYITTFEHRWPIDKTFVCGDSWLLEWWMTNWWQQQYSKLSLVLL